MGGCASRHARVSGCTLDGARGGRQGAGEVRGDSSDRWWRSHREGAWTLLYEGGMWGSWWGKLGRVPEVTGPGQTGEREGEC